MGKWKYSSTLLDLGTSWEVSGQLHMLAALPPGKSSRYPVARRLGSAQSRSGLCEVEKISWRCRESNPGRSARSPSQLYRFAFHLSLRVSHGELPFLRTSNCGARFRVTHNPISFYVLSLIRTYLSYSLTQSLPELRHLSYRGSSLCIPACSVTFWHLPVTPRYCWSAVIPTSSLGR
jgi:hypothetical protein